MPKVPAIFSNAHLGEQSVAKPSYQLTTGIPVLQLLGYWQMAYEP